jgi:predicted nucleic acid-binding protein
MIFVDTSIWYAANVPEDPDHDEARRLLLGATSSPVTTDYVVAELLTLLVARNHRSIAVRVGEDFWSGTSCDLEWAKEEDIWAAWHVFATFDDKTWSFTDCVSYAVMKRLQITEALALDEHFKQFGFAVVRP